MVATVDSVPYDSLINRCRTIGQKWAHRHAVSLPMSPVTI